MIDPKIRFKDQNGEQSTFFIQDPSNNVLEFKSFKDDSKVFKKQVNEMAKVTFLPDNKECNSPSNVTLLEVAKRNINVNLVSPGFISTSMTENLNDDQKNNYLSRIPMMRFGNPEDIANIVFFYQQMMPHI